MTLFLLAALALAANPYLADGRAPLETLQLGAARLEKAGWKAETVFTDDGLPMKVYRTKKAGPALWLLAGIHGEEPAPPNAVAANLDRIDKLAKSGVPVVLFPLCNPAGYSKGWRYPDAPTSEAEPAGHSVGDSDHLLKDKKGKPRAPAPTSSQADALTKKVLALARDYPPLISIDLHEDDHIPAGYIYSQGPKGTKDPAAQLILKKMTELGYPLVTSGKTRFEEPIADGVVGPVQDGSIDELLSTLGAKSVIVVETSAQGQPLPKRVAVHSAVLGLLPELVRLARRP